MQRLRLEDRYIERTFAGRLQTLLAVHCSLIFSSQNSTRAFVPKPHQISRVSMAVSYGELMAHYMRNDDTHPYIVFIPLIDEVQGIGCICCNPTAKESALLIHSIILI